jgi:antitoxin MazE
LKVAKWGNSLAVRLPSPVVEALELKIGDDIRITVVDSNRLEVERTPSRQEIVSRLRKFQGLLPADFKFDRLEANERG